MTARPGTAALAARAAYVLRGNDLGAMTTAAPRLVPHMWSWDAAFVAIGLAKVNLDRAVQELSTLLSAQWATGMLPHIVFASGDRGYFPGPDRWAYRESGAPAPAEPRTSGICQPPVHALAVERIVAAGRHGQRTERAAAEDFLARSWVRRPDRGSPARRAAVGHGGAGEVGHHAHRALRGGGASA